MKCAGTSGRAGTAAGTSTSGTTRAQTAFAGPRFRALYRRWLMDGERVLDAVMSPVLADVVARRVGVLECHVLPYPYLHLLSLAGTA